MSSLTRHEAEQQVRSWGFSTVYTRTDGPNAHYPPHRHNGLTTHLILSGKFTVCFPEDAPGAKETFGPGARIDVPAGKAHEVWMGNEGCTFRIAVVRELNPRRIRWAQVFGGIRDSTMYVKCRWSGLKDGPGQRLSSIEEMIREFFIPTTPPRT